MCVGEFVFPECRITKIWHVGIISGYFDQANKCVPDALFPNKHSTQTYVLLHIFDRVNR